MKIYRSLLLAVALFGITLALPMPTRVETDPELTGVYVEGDMDWDINMRNGLLDETFRWPNNIVYYKFFTHFDKPHRNYIRRGMQIIEEVSCIRFKEATEYTESYVNITGLSGGCHSNVGYLNSGAQSYNLQIYPLDKGCFRLGTVLHEFLHTLGFYHMQSAANRDQYVRIAEENVEEGKMHNFKKYSSSKVGNFDEEYDYGSVLHYSAYAFSANGKMTIVPLKDEGAAVNMGQRIGMSQSDINKLNVMYRCSVNI